MTDARSARLAALRDALVREQLDALVVTWAPNARYLTGFSGSSSLLVVSQREVVLITDFRYETQAASEVAGVARIVIEAQSLWTRLWAVLPDMAGVERLGYESARLVHRDLQRIVEHGARWRWSPTLDVIETLRIRKDPQEVARIRQAGVIAAQALEHTLPRIRPGLTELQVAGLLEHALRDAGSEGYPFPSLVAAGERSALPHGHPSHHAVKTGHLLLLDFGATFEGYCSDLTRTVVVGKATADQRDVYNVVRGAQAQAISGLRAGMAGRDADAIARSYIERAGWGEAFGHSLGHGIGLEVHEAPRLSRTAEGPIPAGSVVTVEPGVYRPGWGGVRIEDDVFLSEAGPEVLTTFSRELLELT
jgi:Xaa-Pro aminopeptidase